MHEKLRYQEFGKLTYVYIFIFLQFIKWWQIWNIQSGLIFDQKNGGYTCYFEDKSSLKLKTCKNQVHN